MMIGILWFLSCFLFIFSPTTRYWERERGRNREEEILNHKNFVRTQQLKSRMNARRKEQAEEEAYDKLVNPHLYGPGAVGGGYRKLRPGEHYEDVQKEFLENEIRIRERRKKYRSPEGPPPRSKPRYGHDPRSHQDPRSRPRYQDYGDRPRSDYHDRGQQRHYRR